MFDRKLVFILIGIIILLAFFNSIISSNYPDGLERVANDHHFSDKARDSFSVFSDYLTFSRESLLSRGLAGLLGIVATYLLVIGLGKLIKRQEDG